MKDKMSVYDILMEVSKTNRFNPDKDGSSFYDKNRVGFSFCINRGLIERYFGTMRLTELGVVVLRRKGWDRHLRIKKIKKASYHGLIILGILAGLYAALLQTVHLFSDKDRSETIGTLTIEKQIPIPKTGNLSDSIIDSTKTVSYN